MKPTAIPVTPSILRVCECVSVVVYCFLSGMCCKSEPLVPLLAVTLNLDCSHLRPGPPADDVVMHGPSRSRPSSVVLEGLNYSRQPKWTFLQRVSILVYWTCLGLKGLMAG